MIAAILACLGVIDGVTDDHGLAGWAALLVTAWFAVYGLYAIACVLLHLAREIRQQKPHPWDAVAMCFAVLFRLGWLALQAVGIVVFVFCAVKFHTTSEGRGLYFVLASSSIALVVWLEKLKFLGAD